MATNGLPSKEYVSHRQNDPDFPLTGVPTNNNHIKTIMIVGKHTSAFV